MICDLGCVYHQGLEVDNNTVNGPTVQLVKQLGILENFRVGVLVIPAIWLRFLECLEGYLQSVAGLFGRRKQLGLVGAVDAECGKNHCEERMGPTRAPVK